jgi:hypothetical protein
MALTSPENQNKLLKDIVFWLPDNNTLKDDEILMLINLTINQVGSEDEKYAEVACKSLKLCAIKNQSSYYVDEASTKKEKTGEVELERFERSGADPWKDYIKAVNNTICPIMGYSPPVSIGLFVNSKAVELDTSCVCDSDLTL